MLVLILPLFGITFLAVCCVVVGGRADRQLEAQRPFELATFWREEL